MRNNIISRILQTALAVFLPLSASAQNLDPTVEVSRTYEGKLMEVHKPQLEMAVPDSVLRFDLEFDYSVTDKPYKGAYEFSPYTVEMKPSPTVYDRKTFYLRVGAGYQLHPELDLVWSPKFNDPFRLNVYASHRSFIGNYLQIDRQEDGDGIVLGRSDKEYDTWHGYDLMNRAGVDGRYDWEKARLSFDFGYFGIEQDGLMNSMRSYNAFDAKVGIASKKQTGFLYGIGARYRLAGETLRGATDMPIVFDSEIKTAELDVETRFGYVFAKGGKALLEVDFARAGMSGDRYYHGYDTDIVPHYVKEVGRWSFDLGVRLSAALASSRFTDEFGVEGQIVYPDVRIEYLAVEDAMKFYADLGGDSRVSTYSDILEMNRHANPYYCLSYGDLLGVSEEKINTSLGIEGRIGPRFSYDLRGGYVKYGNSLMEGLEIRNHESTIAAEMWSPAVGYGSYDKAFAALDWLLDAESVRFVGSVEYAYSWSEEDSAVFGLFLPAALSGDLAFTYNWKGRISAGIDCGFSSARKGSAVYGVYADDGYSLASKPAEIPGYADLGLNLEYAVNRKFSVWARGGNLLGMTIQRNIMYAEKGPYFTAGICLNL